MAHDDPLGPRLIEMEPHGETARLLSSIPAPRTLGADTMARIERRVLDEPSGARRPPLRGLRWWALVSLGVAGVAGATTVATRIVLELPAFEVLVGGGDEGSGREARRARRRLAAAPPAEEGPAASRPLIVPLPAPEPVPPLPPPEPSAAVSPAPAPRSRLDARPAAGSRSRARTAPASAAPLAPAERPPSTLADEAVLLERALHKVRGERDGAAALGVLDEYRRRFPGGELSHEADRTRVEALLLLGRSRPALEVLEGMSFGASMRDVRLQLFRGEMRAESGRCPDAEADFTAVLARAKTGEGAERALYGRASCRSRRGDEAGARADLERYLAELPNGKRATEVRRALGR